MAREQALQTIQILNITDTPVRISSTKRLVTSFLIQNPLENAEFLMIGNSENQFFELAPGNDLELNGDGLDHGTTAYVDLHHWFIRSKSVEPISANILILKGF